MIKATFQKWTYPVSDNDIKTLKTRGEGLLDPNGNSGGSGGGGSGNGKGGANSGSDLGSGGNRRSSGAESNPQLQMYDTYQLLHLTPLMTFLQI